MENEGVFHVIDLADLIEVLKKVSDSHEGTSSDYDRGVRDACLSLMEHYTEVLQDLVEKEGVVTH